MTMQFTVGRNHNNSAQQLRRACLKSTLIKLFKATTVTTVIFCALTACRTSQPPKPDLFADNDSHIQAAWVVLGEQGKATARVITTAAICPVLQQDGVEQKMQVRAQPATIAQRRTSSSAAQSKPAEFLVLTCELPLKQAITSAKVGGRNLPLPKSVPLKILVLGDTGCRLKSSASTFQDCNDNDHWTFSTVAKTAASFAPDLVVHVGDYPYRENPCPVDNAGCAGSPSGFGWDTWQADFFTPAAPLLLAAPWVMARGNHESCFRGGQGWWRFMDTRPLQPARDCNLEVDDMLGDYSEPYAVPLGAGAQLIVFDSAKAPSKPLTKEDPAFSTYLAQYHQADQLAQQANFSLFLTHHPVLGLSTTKNKAEIKSGNAALQSVFKEIHPQRLFDSSVQILLAGHVHLFEAITFKSDHPMQFVVGNGGALPHQNLPAVLPLTATPFVNAEVAHFNSTDRSGFITMERATVNSTDWVVKSWDKNGVLMTTCEVSRLKKECR